MQPTRRRKPKSRKRRVRRTKMLGNPEKNPQKGREEDTQGQQVPTLEELRKEFQGINSGEAASRSKMKGTVLKESIAVKKLEADAKRGEPAKCGRCRKPHEEGDFYINCEICDKWFHLTCVGLEHMREEPPENFMCLVCQSTGFAPTASRKESWYLEPKSQENYAQALEAIDAELAELMKPEPQPQPEPQTASRPDVERGLRSFGPRWRSGGPDEKKKSKKKKKLKKK